MSVTITDRRATGGVGAVVGLLAGAHFSHHVLTALIVPLLPFIRNEFGLTYAQSGLVTAAFTIAYGFGQLPAGWLADRVGPRYLLLMGISGVAAAGMLVGLAPLFAVMVAGLVLMGAAGGGYHPAASAVISNLVHPDRRGRALGVHIVGGSTSHFIAPLMAAGLVTALGWRGTFVTLSIPVALLGALLFVLIHRSMQQEAAGRRSAVEAAGPQPDTGVAAAPDARHAQPVRRYSALHMTFFLILTGMVGAGISSVIPYLPLYLVDHRGVDERLAAAFLATLYAAGFFAAPLGGLLSDRLGRVRVMAVTGLLTGPAIALVLIAPFPVPLAAAFLLVGILMFVKMPTSEAHIASEVSQKNRATVLGVYFFSGMEGSALLTPLLGAAIDRWGFAAGISGMGVIVLIVVAACAAGMGWSRPIVPGAGVMESSTGG